jgi:HK97 family phage major capsid protein
MAERDEYKPKQSIAKPDDEELVYFGGEIKDLGGGKVGGYLIRWSQPDGKDADLTEDYFTKDGSTVEIPMTNLPIFYAHGTDSKIKKSIIGRGSVKFDDVGVWLESQLDQRTEYEKAVLAMAKAGKLGYSSGALSHLVERQDTGGGKHLIKTWVVGEGSLTPRPAEPRNQVLPLKSLFTSPGGVADSEDANPIQSQKEIHTMDEKEVKDLLAAALKEQRDADTKAAEVKAAAEKHDAEIADAAEKKVIAEMTAKGMIRTSYHTTDPKKTGDDNEGVQAFKSWLATGQANGGLIQPDEVWMKSQPVNLKGSNFVSNSGADGAYLVPDPLYGVVQAKRDLASFIRQAPTQHFSTPSDHLLVPVEDTKASAFVKTNEVGTYNSNKPTVAQKDIQLFKYTKDVPASEEFLSYQGTNFDAWLTSVLARAEAVTENTLYTNGTGTGEAQGALTGATVANTGTASHAFIAGDLAALVGYLGAGYNVMGETGFLMNNVSKWYAKGLTSNYFAFIPTPSAGPNAGYGGTIGEPGFFGYPAYVSDDMPAHTSTGNKSVLYGNWTLYGLLEKPGMMVQRNPYIEMNKGLIHIYANIFRGGAVLQSEAFYYMTEG